jgi:hypothetical protein
VKLGCFGCFFLVVLILAMLVVIGGVLFLSASIFATPDVHTVSFSKADGYAAQQKLYEVALRDAGRSSRKEPIILTEREANAFVSRHLAEGAGVRLSPLTVRFDRGYFFAQGQAPLRNLFQAPVLVYLIPYIPDKRLDQPVWVSVRGQISIEGPSRGGGRYAKVAVAEFMLGRQPINSFLFYAVTGPSGGGLLRWPVPGVVESVQIEQGQAIIRTR